MPGLADHPHLAQHGSSSRGGEPVREQEVGDG
jgi:hypothetical protein